MSNHTNLFATL